MSWQSRRGSSRTSAGSRWSCNCTCVLCNCVCVFCNFTCVSFYVFVKHVHLLFLLYKIYRTSVGSRWVCNSFCVLWNCVCLCVCICVCLPVFVFCNEMQWQVENASGFVIMFYVVLEDKDKYSESRMCVILKTWKASNFSRKWKVIEKLGSRLRIEVFGLCSDFSCRHWLEIGATEILTCATEITRNRKGTLDKIGHAPVISWSWIPNSQNILTSRIMITASELVAEWETFDRQPEKGSKTFFLPLLPKQFPNFQWGR